MPWVTEPHAGLRAFAHTLFKYHYTKLTLSSRHLSLVSNIWHPGQICQSICQWFSLLYCFQDLCIIIVNKCHQPSSQISILVSIGQTPVWLSNLSLSHVGKEGLGRNQ